MSIGEILSLYESEELDIHPEFQRFFRWTPSQKSRLIESILLGIPIPPIFVAQSEQGVWDVVDGLQRLSTVFEFAGILKDENKKRLQPLELEGTKYLPALEGKKWEDEDDEFNSFSQAQRLYVKRAKLDVSIILRESDEKTKFELFQRLNTGGSPLSDQEVRNCIIVMLDRDTYFWLRSLASDTYFQECIAVTEKALSEQYDMELVLRFIIFRSMGSAKLSKIGDVGDFLSDEIVDLITKGRIDQDEEEKTFRQTFRAIATNYGADAFRRYDQKKKRHFGGFLLSTFEIVAMGIGFHGGGFNGNKNDFAERIKKMWSDKVFQTNSGSGVRASSRIPKLVPLGRKLFKV
jgi:hypothetical protein